MSEPDDDAAERLEERLTHIEASLKRIERQLEALSPPTSRSSGAEDGFIAGTPAATEDAREEEADRAAPPSGDSRPDDPDPADAPEGGPGQTPEADAPADTAAEPEEADRAAESAPAPLPPLTSRFELEAWLDKIGIALLLLGLGFLYKLSVEMGLVNATVKVGLGFSIGGVLGWSGWRTRASRRRLSQILLGGSSAAFYISIFAANQLYDLFNQPVAFAGMSAVTMATFIVASDQRDVALSMVGALGGFLTPFVLSSGSNQYVGLSLYNTVLVSGMIAIVIMRGWRSLLAVTALGGWLLAGGAAVGVEGDGSAVLASTAIVQLGLVVVWLAIGVAPAIRAWLKTSSEAERKTDSLRALLIHLLTFSAPLFALGLSRLLWDVSSPTWSVVYTLIGAAYFAASLRLEEARRLALPTTARLVGAVLVAVAIFEFFSTSTVPFVLSILAVALGYAARRLDDDWLLLPSLFLATGTGLWLGLDLLADPSGESLPFLNPYGLRALGIVGALFVVSTFFDEESTVRLGYRYSLHIVALLLLYHEATLAAEGELLATTLWGMYAIGLLVIGLYAASRQLKYVGFATLILAVGKLLLVDMAEAETIWRVLLFLGFGAALLLLSYFAPSLNGETTPDEEGDGDDGRP